MQTAKRNPDAHPAAVRTSGGRGLHAGSSGGRGQEFTDPKPSPGRPMCTNQASAFIVLSSLPATAQGSDARPVLTVLVQQDCSATGIPQCPVQSMSSSDGSPAVRSLEHRMHPRAARAHFLSGNRRCGRQVCSLPGLRERPLNRTPPLQTQLEDDKWLTANILKPPQSCCPLGLRAWSPKMMKPLFRKTTWPTPCALLGHFLKLIPGDVVLRHL